MTYNLPGFKWEIVDGVLIATGDHCSSRMSQAVEGLTNQLNLLGLRQFNTFPDVAGNVLDLIFSNGTVLDFKVSECPLLKVDEFHPPLEIVLKLDLQSSGIRYKEDKYNFKAGDYASITSELLRIDWAEFLSSPDLDSVLLRFVTKLRSLIDCYVPKSINFSSSYPVWYSQELKKVLVDEKRMYLAVKTFNLENDRVEFRMLRSLAKTLSDRDYKSFIVKTESTIDANN